jgi:short-subunit dehydrogenase
MGCLDGRPYGRDMTKIMTIFGAGPAFGLSVARRFGREGYELALVARNEQRLNDHVEKLASEGIEAHAFTADLADPAHATRILTSIQQTLGPPDVLLYSAMGDLKHVARPLDVDADNLSPLLDQILRTPVALVHQALPDLTERGDGGVLFSYGASALAPYADLANVGIAMSALRYYMRLLHHELAPRGVYVGGLAITALIEGTAPALALGESMPDVPVVSPDTLADTLWTQFAERQDPDGVAPRPLAA